MTSQNAQIQALLNGIDEVLSKTSPRLPWVMSNDAVQQRQMLEQTRQYLLALQQQQEDAQLLAPNPMPGAVNSPAPSVASSSESAQQVLQSVLQEMNYWRVNMLQPLRNEIDALQHQREVLSQEIRRLEVQRHQYGLPQQNQQMLVEFLQAAMAQMQANLSAQVTQMIAAQASPALQSSDRPDPQKLVALDPAERLAQLQKMQAQSDQLMLKLDATLKVIFESLNRNIHTYQDSLEQGLDRMHNLGQQGETMFAFFVNRLAQQVGREASSVLQASGRQGDAAALPANPTISDASDFVVADFLSQVPEPAPARPLSFAPAVPFDLSEEVLDISELDLSEEILPESDTLESLNRELSQLDLGSVAGDAGSELDLFAGDVALPSPIQAQSAPIEVASSSDLTDLDSALDLLNQLSAEMQTDRSIDSIDAIDLPGPSLPQPPSAAASEPTLIATPDSLYDDAFYTNQGAGVDAVEPKAGASFGVDAMTLEQEWFAGLGDPAAQDLPKLSESEVQLEPPANLVDQSSESLPLSAPTQEDLFADFSTAATPSEISSNVLLEPSEPEVAAATTDTITKLTDLLPPDWQETPSTPIQNEPILPDEAAPPVGLQELPIAEAPSETFHLALGLLNQPGSVNQQAGDSLSSSNASPLDPAQASVTIEGLESLFEDVPNLPQVASADFLTAPSGATEPTVPAEDWSEFFPNDDTDAEKKN